MFVLEQTGQFNYYLNNNGTCTANATFTGFYLSTDSIFDPSDLLLKNDLADHVAPGKQNNNLTHLYIPASVTPGNYYLILKADNTAILNESNETNNFIHKAIQVMPSLVDLKPYSLSYYSGYYSYMKFYPGGPVPVSSTLINVEYRNLDTSVVRYYFSTDTLIDSSDAPLAYSYRGTNIPTRYFNHYDTLIVPAGISPGSYYLIMETDPLNMFAETNESNNVKYCPIQIHSATMDIAFYNAYFALYNYTAAPGGTVSFNMSVRDIGNISLPYPSPINNGYYLSSDTLLDSSDILLGGSTCNISSWGTYSVTIPVGVSPGAYYIIFHIDSSNTYSESNEINNFYHAKIDIYPDVSELSIEGFHMNYQPIFAGTHLYYLYTIRNHGHGNAIGTMIHYCLSADSILDVNDTLLSMSTVNVTGNSAVLLSTYNLLPSGVSGLRYIILRVDPFNMIAEPDETNNQLIIPLNIEDKIYDLSIVSNSLASASISAGTSLPVKSSLKLTGNNYLTGQTIVYYLSSDTIYDGTDVTLSSTMVGYVSHNPAYAPAITNGMVTIPSGTANGTYYILFRADHNNTTTETNETNNIAFSVINIVPPVRDLYVKTNRITDYALTPGSSFNIRSLVYNTGTAGSASYKIGYYLSTDSVFSAGDLFLSAPIRNDLAPSICDSSMCSVSIPGTVSPGNYYLIAYADYFNIVTETSEANNYFSSRVSIVGGFSDLVKGGISAYFSYTPGQITVYLNYLNSCNLYQYNVNTAFYLSADTIADAGDVLIGTQTTSMLSPGQQFGSNLYFTLPPGTSTNSYYVVAKIDHLNAIPEINELNNTSYVRLSSSYYSSAIDLRISDLECADTLETDINSTFSARIYSSGGGTTTSPVGIYLSSDWQLDYVDLLLTSLDSGNLSYYSSSIINPQFSIPDWVNPGIYYLIAAIDHQNLIHEYNEMNNTIIKPVYIAAITDIVEHAENFDLIIYPNPSSGTLNFKGHFAEEEWGDKLIIEVINTQGKTIYRDEFKNDVDIDKKISISEATTGLYFLKISGSLKSTTEKLVKMD
jgi:subtilase family serine protease